MTFQYYWGANSPPIASYFRRRLLNATTNAVLQDIYNVTNLSTPADAIWTPHTADLSSYAGQSVYLQVEAADNDTIGFEAAIDNVLAVTKDPTGLSGQVWHDADNDGLLEGGENGLQNILVELLDTNQLTVDDPALPAYQGARRFTDGTGN